MTTQITIRISDESVAFIDSLVSDGREKSRAAAIDKIVRRQQRRVQSEHDATIYLREGENPEMVAFADAAYASRFGEDAEVPPEDRGEFDRLHPRSQTRADRVSA